MRALETVMLRYQGDKETRRAGEQNSERGSFNAVLLKRDQTYISGLLLDYWTLDSQSIQGERVNSNRKVWRSKKK